MGVTGERDQAIELERGRIDVTACDQGERAAAIDAQRVHAKRLAARCQAGAHPVRDRQRPPGIAVLEQRIAERALERDAGEIEILGHLGEPVVEQLHGARTVAARARIFATREREEAANA